MQEHLGERWDYGAQVTQHGACLGLGLAALGTEDEMVFEEIKNVLYTDSAVAGEAAGIALGLVSVGSATEKASELLTYAHDTQHEKVRPSPFPVAVLSQLHLRTFNSLCMSAFRWKAEKC